MTGMFRGGSGTKKVEERGERGIVKSGNPGNEINPKFTHDLML